MKKFYVTALIMLGLPLYVTSQMIEDFEMMTLSSVSNGSYPDDSLVIVNNPSPGEVNNSMKVLRFRRSKDGESWAGFSGVLPKEFYMDGWLSYNISAQIMTPRITEVKLKIEFSDNREIEAVAVPAKTDEWETLTFDFGTNNDGNLTKITLMPDYKDPLDLTEDIIIYIDNIVLQHDHAGYAAKEMLESFETIPLKQLSNSNLPDDSLVVVPNPAPDDVNSSAHVLKFRRSSAGDIWAGFWSELPIPVDMTNYKYFYVKVWKPRISGVNFKVEGGSTNPSFFELPSIRAQTTSGAWEQMVFFFPDATGEYPRIAVLPDFQEPVGLGEDMDLYIDDIMLSILDSEPTAQKKSEKLVFNLFPNPVMSTLYFENLDGVESIRVFNSTGQQVIVQQLFNKSTALIDVSFLPGGLYVVSVFDKYGNSATRKIVKEY